MSTPSGGGHAVHLISSGGSREQPGKNVVTGPKQAKQKGQINEPPPPAVPVHPAHAHILSHTDLDPRVALSGAGGGGHHGPPPPRKVEAIGMIDAWTRMPPQYASQAASLDPTAFMSSSPAAYYHPPPVSPYGAAAAYASIGGIKTECHHGSAAAAGAPWSNGTDVASYFGYPPTSADFHHHHHHHHHAADPAGMFGNGYPTAAGTYTSNFGYSPFPTPTHTAPGSAVSPQDYTGWAATTTTTPHDLVERAPHQKNPYGGGTTAGDYYSYDIIGAAPSMMTAGLDMGPPAAAAVPPITVNCDERVKSLGTRIENLSIAGFNEQHQHHLNESGQVDAVTDGRVDPSTTARVSHQEGSAVERHRKGGGGESSAADSKDTTEPNNNNNNNDAADDADSGNGGGKTSANNENHAAAAAATGGEVSLPGASTCSGGGGPPAHHPQQQQQVSDNESVPAADSTTTIEESATTTESSIHLSNWNWIDEEVKDWSASPPPAATVPSGVEQDNEDVVDRTDDDDDDWNQLLFKDDIDSVGDHLTTQEQQEQTSAHLLQDLKRKNNYNPSELDLRVEGARFFVIKSYSEDDVHRSIKYSIWCSTEHGNKKLDQAFRHQKNLPIYLFYSVNGSGHFCGMAQMTSSVDYDTLTGVWAQDKWKGKFNVKWIYVKDIPNPELRHIRLENNENKPVTNSRDTQEIPPDKGRQVLEIMHKYRHETSLFDDFVYYEDMEHKREAERDLHDSAGPRTSAAAGAATSSSSSSTFRNFPPKRKGDESRDGYPSNGNHHHHHHHRDNHHHHHGKDYRDPRDHATSRRSTARSFGGAGYNRDDRPFGAGYRSNETDSPQPPPAQRSSNHHVGRSFTTCTSSYKRDRDGGGGSNAGNERTLFSNRYNTQLRNDSAHWRS